MVKRPFFYCVDNNPLTYVMAKPKVSKLTPYTFDLKHIYGIKNIVADALSRDPFA